MGVMTTNLDRLPELCYAVHIDDGRTIVIKRGEEGYYETGYGVQGQPVVDQLNADLGVSRRQAAAMKFGSFAGFYAPGANPDLYDDDGKPIRLRA